MDTPIRDIQSLEGIPFILGHKYVLKNRLDSEEDGTYIFNGTSLIRPANYKNDVNWQTFINQTTNAV